jgi:hypothetical protein
VLILDGDPIEGEREVELFLLKHVEPLYFPVPCACCSVSYVKIFGGD